MGTVAAPLSEFCHNGGKVTTKTTVYDLKKNLLESRIMSIIIKVTDLSRKVDNLSKVVSDKKDYRVCTKSGKPGK